MKNKKPNKATKFKNYLEREFKEMSAYQKLSYDKDPEGYGTGYDEGYLRALKNVHKEYFKTELK